jgi:cell fate (sporulation/competence/biofilm development) regulator YlbF (YheA/YmcA/DUF963 family)
MADIQELLSKASALGEALAANPTVSAHYRAQNSVRSDPAAQKLLQEYQTQVERIHELERNKRPVEVADKHKLADLERQLVGNETLKNLMRTQADYAAVMARVNKAMEAPLAALTEREKPE